MTINNVSFSNVSFNGLRLEEKPAAVSEEEKIQQ